MAKTKKSQALADLCKKAPGRISVFNFFYEYGEWLAQLGRSRSSEMLMTTLNRFVEFRNRKDCSFYRFNSEMMELFEAYLRTRGLKRNTIGFYLRILRTAYNRAVEQKVTKDRKPFRRVYTGKDKTMKRALHATSIRAIMRMDLSCFPHLDYARDMFLFRLFSRGMSFVDMAFLRKTDRIDRHFCYCRRKTGQMLVVEWIPEMQKILNKYPVNPTQYLLPIIVRRDTSDRRQYLSKISCVNRNLKIVGRLARATDKLTLYYARHTWSTMARTKKIPLSVISEALGHDSEKTTQIYLDSIQTEVVDKANRAVLKEFLK